MCIYALCVFVCVCVHKCIAAVAVAAANLLNLLQ